MNSSSNAPDSILSNSVNNGSLGYGIGVSVVLLLITVITSATYFCTRATINNSVVPARSPPPAHHFSVSIDVGEGLDEATLSSYPKLLYSEAKADSRGGDSASACCSICLADYQSNDVLRQLPDCSHMFHLRCIDKWLRLHPTCPVCRTSPMPTPLAEVVPPASRHSSVEVENQSPMTFS